MAPTYCAATDVLFYLGMSGYGSSLLTQAQIEDIITKCEADFNERTNNSFLAKRVTNERHYLDRVKVGPMGKRLIAYRVRANFFPLQTFVSGTHKIEILRSDGYYDLVLSTNNCVEGWLKDYWIDFEKGWIFFMNKYPHYRIGGCQLTYDWGHAAVPLDVEDATAMMAALKCIMGPSRMTVEIAEGGGSIPDQSIVSEWKEQIERTIGNHFIIPSK